MGGRAAKTPDVPCEALQYLYMHGMLTELFGVCYLACTLCGITMRRRGLETTCGLCVPAAPMVCCLCPSIKIHKTVAAFEDSGAGGVRSLGLCTKHANPLIQDKTIWSRHLLMQQLYAAIATGQNKRFGSAVKRI